MGAMTTRTVTSTHVDEAGNRVTSESVRGMAEPEETETEALARGVALIDSYRAKHPCVVCGELFGLLEPYAMVVHQGVGGRAHVAGPCQSACIPSPK